MSSAISRPPFGLCVPVEVVDVHDGDTVYVRVYDPSTKQDGLTTWHVRLMDCWAPEIHGAEKSKGAKSRTYLQRLLADADESISLFVPFTGGASLLTLTTMGRLLGRLYVGEQDVSALMVSAGFATKTKDGKGAVDD